MSMNRLATYPTETLSPVSTESWTIVHPNRYRQASGVVHSIVCSSQKRLVIGQELAYLSKQKLFRAQRRDDILRPKWRRQEIDIDIDQREHRMKQ